MSTPIDVLLVEDNPDDLALVLRALRRLHPADRIEVAQDGVETLDFVFCTGAYVHRRLENPPRVILIGWSSSDQPWARADSGVAERSCGAAPHASGPPLQPAARSDLFPSLMLLCFTQLVYPLLWEVQSVRSLCTINRPKPYGRSADIRTQLFFRPIAFTPCHPASLPYGSDCEAARCSGPRTNCMVYL
jgi:hypothetical protein